MLLDKYLLSMCLIYSFYNYYFKAFYFMIKFKLFYCRRFYNSKQIDKLLIYLSTNFMHSDYTALQKYTIF